MTVADVKKDASFLISHNQSLVAVYIAHHGNHGCLNLQTRLKQNGEEETGFSVSYTNSKHSLVADDNCGQNISFLQGI